LPHQSDPDRAFAILGLRPGCSPVEIKNRYKQLVRTWHPDRWADNSTNEMEAAQRMRDINWAWQILQQATDASAEPHVARAHNNGAPTDAPSTFGRHLSDAEVKDIVQAIGSQNPVKAIGGFLLWAIPLAGAFVITSGHGRPLSNFWIPPTGNEKLAAAGLVLFAIGVLIRRMWVRRN
jgi:DnaJ domain